VCVFEPFIELRDSVAHLIVLTLVVYVVWGTYPCFNLVFEKGEFQNENDYFSTF